MTHLLHAARALKTAAAFFVVSLLVTTNPAAADAAVLERRVAVAWNEGFQGPGRLQAMSVLPPWSFDGPARACRSCRRGQRPVEQPRAIVLPSFRGKNRRPRA